MREEEDGACDAVQQLRGRQARRRRRSKLPDVLALHSRIRFKLSSRKFRRRFDGPHSHFLRTKTSRVTGCGGLTLSVSGLVFRLPLSSGCSGGTGDTGWVKRSRLCLLYCRAQSQTGGSGGSDASAAASGWSVSLQPFTGVYDCPRFCLGDQRFALLRFSSSEQQSTESTSIRSKAGFSRAG